MANILTSPFLKASDADGNPISGALLYFFYSGTTTPAPIYTDASLATPLTNPVQALASGEFPAVFLSPIIAYRVRQTAADGSLLRPEADPVYGKDPALQSIESIMLNGAVLAQVDDRIYDTRAALNADLAPAADDLAVVIADPDPTNVDFYRKVGGTGTGSWTKLGFNAAMVQQYSVDAAASATQAGTYRDQAGSFALGAYNSEQAAINSAATASTAATTATTAATNALASEELAEDYKDAAADSALEISDSLAVLQLVEDIYGLPITPGNAPFLDTFADGSGTSLRLRSGYTTIVQSPTFNSQLDSITVGPGYIGGTTGAQAYGLKTGTSTIAWVDRVINVAPFAYLLDHVTSTPTPTPTPLIDRFRIQATHGTIGGLMQGNYNVQRIDDSSAPALITNGAQGNLRVEAGDVISHRYAQSGSDIVMTVWVNGRQASPVLTMSGNGVPFSNNWGISGDAGAQALRAIEVGYPATDAIITLFAPNRVVHRNTDGSVTWRLSGQYTGPAVQAVRVNLIDETTGVAAPGMSGVLATGVTSSNGNWSGTVTAPASAFTAGRRYRLEIYRRGVVNSLGVASTSRTTGPWQRVGDVIFTYGQSLGVGESRQGLTTVGTWTPVTGSFWVGGEYDPLQPDNFYRRQLPITANTVPAAFSQTLGAITSRPVLSVNGGFSSTTILERSVGSTYYNALIDAIQHGGGRGILRWVDGQSDISTPDANYEATFVTIMTAIQALYPEVKVMMVPCSSAWSAGTNYHRIRRLQWDMTRRLTQFIVGLGAFSNGLQKLDSLHFNNDGYALITGRNAHCYAKIRGYETYDGNGPALVGFSKVSSSRLRCVFSLGRFSGLELINSAYAGDFAGGLGFATSPAFSSLNAPTAFTIDGAPSGGTQGIEFDFSGTPFTGTAYVRAVYGDNPFNFSNNTTINADLLNRASMIRGIGAGGEPNVEIQPYYHASGNDWLSA